MRKITAGVAIASVAVVLLVSVVAHMPKANADRFCYNTGPPTPVVICRGVPPQPTLPVCVLKDIDEGFICSPR